MQQAFGYLDGDALAYVGGSLGVPLSGVYGVATFYAAASCLSSQSDPVLVVGYGNSLRGDDGLGWHAAGLLAAERSDA